MPSKVTGNVKSLVFKFQCGQCGYNIALFKIPYYARRFMVNGIYTIYICYYLTVPGTQAIADGYTVLL